MDTLHAYSPLQDQDSDDEERQFSSHAAAQSSSAAASAAIASRSTGLLWNTQQSRTDFSNDVNAQPPPPGTTANARRSAYFKDTSMTVRVFLVRGLFVGRKWLFPLLLACSAFGYEIAASTILNVIGDFYLAISSLDVQLFLQVLWRSLLVVTVVAFLKAMRDLCKEACALVWRQGLVSFLHCWYLHGKMPYALCAAEAGRTKGGASGKHASSLVTTAPSLDNPDQRVTADADTLTTAFAKVVQATLVVPGLVTYYTWYLVGLFGWTAPAACYLYFIVASAVNWAVIKKVVPYVYAREKAEGTFRYDHAWLRTHSESVVFCGTEAVEGRERERMTSSFDAVVSASWSVIRQHVPLYIFTQFFDYLGSIINYAAVGSAILYLSKAEGMGEAEIAALIARGSYSCLYIIDAFSQALRASEAASRVGGSAGRVAELLRATGFSDGDARSLSPWSDGLPATKPTTPRDDEGLRRRRWCRFRWRAGQGEHVMRENGWEDEEGSTYVTAAVRRRQRSFRRGESQTTEVDEVGGAGMPQGAGSDGERPGHRGWRQHDTSTAYDGRSDNGRDAIEVEVKMEEEVDGSNGNDGGGAGEVAGVLDRVDGVIGERTDGLRSVDDARVIESDADTAASATAASTTMMSTPAIPRNPILDADDQDWLLRIADYTVARPEQQNGPLEDRQAFMPGRIRGDREIDDADAPPPTLAPLVANHRHLRVEAGREPRNGPEAIVQKLDVVVRRRENLLVTGPSGCGKTSLLRSIAGLWEAEGGTVQVHPRVEAERRAQQARGTAFRAGEGGRLAFARGKRGPGGGVIFVPQRSYCFRGTLFEQVTYPSRPDPDSASAIHEILMDLDLSHLILLGGGGGSVTDRIVGTADAAFDAAEDRGVYHTGNASGNAHGGDRSSDVGSLNDTAYPNTASARASRSSRHTSLGASSSGGDAANVDNLPRNTSGLVRVSSNGARNSRTNDANSGSDSPAEQSGGQVGREGMRALVGRVGQDSRSRSDGEHGIDRDSIPRNISGTCDTLGTGQIAAAPAESGQLRRRERRGREDSDDRSAGTVWRTPRAQRDWASILSIGEQQRLGIARVLYHRPALAFLDESTSAISETAERKAYALMKSAGVTVVAVGHRSSLRVLHERTLSLDGAPEGGWALR